MSDELAAAFERHRPRLRALAYRMLGSLAEADDAVQDAWVRMSGAGADHVDNLAGWLTTVVSRVCLNALRSRSRRREEPLDFHVPDVIVSGVSGHDPETEAVVADSVGLALLVVLDTLTPAERLAFVLHDLFDLPYERVAALIERTPEATRQVASRARRRVRGAAEPDRNQARRHDVVDAFLVAARDGDFAALTALLADDVRLRIDVGGRPGSTAVAGANAVAGQTMRGLASSLSRPSVRLRPVLVNGGPGVVATVDARPVSIIGFVLVGGLIAEINAIADPDRIASLVPSL